MILLRLLLLAIVLDGFVPPPVATAASSAPAAGLSASRDGGNGSGPRDLVCFCAGCLADPDEAARPLEHVLPNLSNARGFAAIGGPFTEEHLRLLFRPPISC